MYKETHSYWALKKTDTGAYFNEAFSEPSIQHALFAGTVNECTVFDTKETAEKIIKAAKADLANGKQMDATELNRLNFLSKAKAVKIDETVIIAEAGEMVTDGFVQTESDRLRDYMTEKPTTIPAPRPWWEGGYPITASPLGPIIYNASNDDCHTFTFTSSSTQEG